MSGFMINDQPRGNSQPINVLPERERVSRQMIIETGINFLHELGTDQICKVCIANSGSCCIGCRHLLNGAGCQQRNTSCTAWLCGYLKYMFYETGLLKEWNEFWNQVPGQDFREDYTPDYIFIKQSLSIQDQTMKDLSEALAADLQELAQSHIAIGFILTLREEIDNNIDRLMDCKNDPKQETKIKRKIKILSSPFYRFHKALSEYRQRQINT